MDKLTPKQDFYIQLELFYTQLKETSPIFWQMSNNYNFSLFMLGDKGVSILNIEY